MQPLCGRMEIIMKTKRITALICLILSTLLVLSCTSCAIKVNAEELSSGYKRIATEKGQVDKNFKTAMADFSFKLFKGVLTKDDKNDLVSPLSATIALAMVANGADGDTLTQIESVLGMDIETLNKVLYTYTTSLYSAKDSKLNLANSIWFRDDDSFEVNKNFLQTNADWYNAQIYASPFDDSTIKAINDWCSKHTDGMIKEMVDNISADSMMYLFNALVFEAKWAEEYNKEQVVDSTFKNYNGNQSDVKMLSSTEKIFINGEGYKGIAKNYKGDQYSFVALLPDEGIDIYDFVNSFDGDKWLFAWNTRKLKTEVKVLIPEFTYETEMELKDTLTMLGMQDMFTGKADFSKLGKMKSGQPLYCSSVLQKTFIEVNRYGTKASAVTKVEIKTLSMPEMVSLNRPFMYALVDNKTGLPFFIGTVTNLE